MLFETEKLLCSSDVQNYQTIYLEKNTSNNTDYIDSLKRFDNISSQPNQKTSMLSIDDINLKIKYFLLVYVFKI